MASMSKLEKQYRLDRILEMREDERTLDYCGRKLGISKQRVDQIIKKHEADLAAKVKVSNE